MIQAIFQMVALTKFIIWIKNSKKYKINGNGSWEKLDILEKKIIIYIQVLIQLQERDQMVQSFIIAPQKKQIKLSKKRSISFVILEVNTNTVQQMLQEHSVLTNNQKNKEYIHFNLKRTHWVATSNSSNTKHR